jgi:hypothetical protein
MFNKLSKSFLSFLIPVILMMFIIIPFFAGAQGTGNPGSGVIKIENPFKQNTIQGLINTIINDILIPIGGVVSVLMVMWAGFLFVTARGNTTQISQAKDALLWAVIGAAILLGAWVISTAIQTTINQLKG